MTGHKRLARSSGDRMIAGVCGGIADYFGWGSTLVRAAYVLVSIFSAAFPGILVYLALWILLPPESRIRSGPDAAA
jgi:phage shock protein C